MIEVVSVCFSNGVIYFFKNMQDLRDFLKQNKLGYFKDMRRIGNFGELHSQYVNLISYKSQFILKAYKLFGNRKEGAKYRLEVLKNEV